MTKFRKILEFLAKIGSLELFKILWNAFNGHTGFKRFRNSDPSIIKACIFSKVLANRYFTGFRNSDPFFYPKKPTIKLIFWTHCFYKIQKF